MINKIENFVEINGNKKNIKKNSSKKSEYKKSSKGTALGKILWTRRKKQIK